MKVLMTLIRRELQEHKVGFIYAPFIVTCILSLVVISVYFGITDIQTTEFNFTTEIYENEEALEWMATANSAQITSVIRSGLVVLGLPILITVAFAILAFNLSCLLLKYSKLMYSPYKSFNISSALITFLLILECLTINFKFFFA